MDWKGAAKKLLLKDSKTPDDDARIVEHLDMLPDEDFNELKKELEEEREEKKIHPDVFLILERERRLRRLQHLP